MRVQSFDDSVSYSGMSDNRLEILDTDDNMKLLLDIDLAEF